MSPPKKNHIKEYIIFQQKELTRFLSGCKKKKKKDQIEF